MKGILKRTMSWLMAAACALLLLPAAARAEETGAQQLQYGDVLLYYPESKAAAEEEKNAHVVYELYRDGVKQAATEAVGYAAAETPSVKLHAGMTYLVNGVGYGADASVTENPALQPQADGSYSLALAEGETRYFSVFLVTKQAEQTPEQTPGQTPEQKPEPKTFTVTFDGNGADTAADPTAMTVTEPARKLAALPKEPLREDYAFQGWNTEKDGSGTAFTLDTEVKADITVYAQWEKEASEPGFTRTYVVRFESNGGSEVEKQRLTFGQKVKEPKDPTRDGYRFAGWYQDAKLTRAWDFDRDRVDESITLYAKWQREGDVYTIRITTEGNGDASHSGTLRVEEGEDIQIKFKPNKGYGVKSVKVDGKTVKAASSYTFRNVQDDHTLHVTFASLDAIYVPSTGGASATWAGAACILLALAAGGYLFLRRQRQK